MSSHLVVGDQLATDSNRALRALATAWSRYISIVGLTAVAAGVAYGSNGGGVSTVPIATVNSLNTPVACKMPYANMWHGTLTPSGTGALASFNPSLGGSSLMINNVANADFSQAGAVAIDITNPNGTEADFMIIVHDSSGGSIHNYFSVPANSSQSIALLTCATNLPASVGMTNLPSPYAGVNSVPGYPGDRAKLSSVHDVMIAPWGSSPVTSLVISNLRLLPQVNWTNILTGHVDAYGQSSLFSWAGKLTDPSQFATRRAAEESSFGNLLAGTVDAYGGSLNLPAQMATGHFRTAKVNGKWWLVTPSGHLFFMNGVDGVNPTSSATATIVSNRQSQFASLPVNSDPLAQNYLDASTLDTNASGTAYDFYTANLQRKYGVNWAPSFLSTLQSRFQTWGLNTLGSFSSATVTNSHILPYIKKTDIIGTFNTVSTGSDAHGPMPDPFDPLFKSAAIQQANSLAPLNFDPYLIGFVVNNEPSWTGLSSTATAPYALALGTLSQNASTSPAKAEFVAELSREYVRISRLNRAWNTHFVSFAAMKAPLAFSANISYAMQRDLSHWVGIYAKQYYKIVSSAFKAVAPNTLFFGSSLSRFTPQVVSAEATYCDVLAFNMYGTEVWPSITSATQNLNLPMVSTEWNFTSTSEGLYGAFSNATPDQTSRAQAYTNYVQTMLTNPNFVGCNFFLYTDYPTAGSIDDQQNNVEGLVDVTDTPYPQMVSAIQSVAKTLYQTRWAS
jgi:hypothetical protein